MYWCNLCLLAGLVLTAPGCLVLRAQHDELAAEVDHLQNQVAQRNQELERTLAEATRQAGALEEKLGEAEALLRANQASVGVRVDDLETDHSKTKGLAEDNQNALAAVGTNLEEMRSDVDARVNRLELSLNEATNIPDGKHALYTEAEKQLAAKAYKQARRLYRTFWSRYPNDPKGPEVRFKVGLTLFSERDFRSALGEFYWITQNARDAKVLPDALYYSGLAFAKLGQCEEAVAYFRYVTKKSIRAPKRYRDQAKQQIKTLEKDRGEICRDRGRSKKRRRGPGKT
ncbi:MAG: tetratricopeptide repeat protein [Nannocystaceae bacterium]